MQLEIAESNLSEQEEAAEIGLDAGIARAVMILMRNGVETFESCEGGQGHSYPEPTVRFHGEYAAGFHAFSVAISYGLPVSSLRRIYTCQDSELKGPWWEMTFATSPRLRYPASSE